MFETVEIKRRVTETLRLLSRYTRGTLDIDMLRGPQNVRKRVEILTLWKQHRVPINKATVTNMWYEFYKMQIEWGTGFTVGDAEFQKENLKTWAAGFLCATREDTYNTNYERVNSDTSNTNKGRAVRTQVHRSAGHN